MGGAVRQLQRRRAVVVRRVEGSIVRMSTLLQALLRTLYAGGVGRDVVDGLRIRAMQGYMGCGRAGTRTSLRARLSLQSSRQ